MTEPDLVDEDLAEVYDRLRRTKKELEYWRGLVQVARATPSDSPRSGVLDEAKGLINGDRNNHYGPPTQDFARTAGVLNALGYRGPDQRELRSHDVALLIAAVKISRLMWTPERRDSWVDLAGYAACGYECAIEEPHHAQSDTGPGRDDDPESKTGQGPEFVRSARDQRRSPQHTIGLVPGTSAPVTGILPTTAGRNEPGPGGGGPGNRGTRLGR